MRYLIFISVLLLSFTASAQTRINDEMVKAYYDSCMTVRDQRMSNDAQDSMCSCTSAKMQETMSVEDIQIMGRNDQDGRNMLNRMMLDIYTPCIAVPLAEIYEDQCIMDSNVQGRNMLKGDMCACAAERTSAWFTTHGRDMMVEILAENPNITDPVNPVLNSKKFKDSALENIMSCMADKKAGK